MITTYEVRNTRTLFVANRFTDDTEAEKFIHAQQTNGGWDSDWEVHPVTVWASFTEYDLARAEGFVNL